MDALAAKLANWLAGHRGQGSLASASVPLGLSYRGSAWAALALCKYDIAGHSNAPQLEIQAATGAVDVLPRTVFTATGIRGAGSGAGPGAVGEDGGVVRRSIPWSLLPSKPEALRIHVQGTGEVQGFPPLTSQAGGSSHLNVLTVLRGVRAAERTLGGHAAHRKPLGLLWAHREHPSPFCSALPASLLARFLLLLHWNSFLHKSCHSQCTEDCTWRSASALSPLVPPAALQVPTLQR